MNTVAVRRDLRSHHEPVGDTHADERFSAYSTAGVVMPGDLLGESYAGVERAVSARYDKIYGDRESASHD